ncbi:GNAT family N-acetyltransferase, partial [Longispora fulva]|uniref:GNAT family N-acetyltransferase n=2 Tax=Bacteria TaxID=2 RepID=UPI0036344CF2
AYLDKAFNNEALKMELLELHSEFWFAKLSGETIGYFKINFEDAQTDLREPDAMELERIYVIEEFQNRGFGQKILDAVIEMAIQRQMRYLWLGVWEKNSRAIRFYERNKFKIIGSHPFWVGKDLQTDILMKLELK